MISFIVPTHNEEKAVVKTLESLRRYTGEHEIIVTDDKSGDQTVAIAKKYADTVLTTEENRGIAANRNRGARVARGEYIAFIDCDVVIADPDAFFKRMYSIFQNDPRVVGATCAMSVEPALETTADRIFLGLFDALYRAMNNVLHIGAATGKFQMIQRDAFQYVGGFDESLVTGEDHELFRRLAKIGRTHFVADERIYFSGRRAHKLGWPRLLFEWMRDSFWILLFHRSKSKVWKDVR